MLRQLAVAVARAAVEGKPYTKSGINGPYERRNELPQAFHSIGKHKFVAWIDALLSQGHLVAAIAEGSRTVKWLDVPNGPVATGKAIFRKGHMARIPTPSADEAEESSATEDAEDV